MAKSVMSRVPEMAEPNNPSSVRCVEYGCIQIVSTVPDGRDDEFLYLGMIARGAVAITGDGDEVFLEPSDIVFCDPARRRFRQFGDDCRMTVFRIPRCYLGISASDLDRVVGVVVPGGDGMGALTSDFLSALAAEAEFHGSLIGDRLARSAVDLIAVLVMALLQDTGNEDASDTSKAKQRDAVPDPHLHRRASDGPGLVTGIDCARAAHLRPLPAQALQE